MLQKRRRLLAVAPLLLAPILAFADEVSDEALAEARAGLADPVAGPGLELPPQPGSWLVTTLVGADVAPGDKQRLFLSASESFAGDSVEIPVLVVRGLHAGPTLCLTAGIHGDELNGIEIVRQTFEDLTPRSLRGMVIALPVANLHGFRRSSRYLPDRRDLNRYFPGHAAGSSAARIASAIFENVVRRCHALVDFHTGSFHRTNLPQLRADLGYQRILSMARSFNSGVVVHSQGSEGTLRRAATEAGIAAVTYEAGEPMRFQQEEIGRGVEGVKNLMGHLGMLRRDPPQADTGRVYYRSRWIRVNDGGIFLTERRLGDRVRVGDELGSVTDPVSNERSRIISPLSGRIIGRAVSQVVIPGFAAFHIGLESAPPAKPAAPAALAPPPPPPAAGVAPVVIPDQLEPEENPE